MNPDGSFTFSSFLNSIGNSLATGYGQGLATQAVGGSRSPGTQQYQNPTVIPSGTAGQPGTAPVVQTTGSLIPGVSNTAVYVGAAVLAIVGGVLLAKAVK